MGKWTQFRKSLPQKPTEQKYQDEVNQARTKLLESGQANLGNLGVWYGKARKAKKEIEEELSACNLTIAALEQMIVGEFEKQGLSQYRLDTGELISITDTPYSSLEDRAKFHAWVKETNQEDLFSVHYQTMNSLVKDRLENGEPAPPGIKVFIDTGVSFRKGTSNG